MLMRKPGILTGALVGAILTAPLIAIFFLAGQFVGLPFVPFDVFDWVGRTLPGPIITFGIDTIVTVIRTFNLGETSSAAKAAEQFMAIAGMFVTGVIAGSALFAVLRGNEFRPRYLPGLILGAVIGIPVMLISNSVNITATADPFVGAAWILAAFLAWGAALAWVYYDLKGKPQEAAPVAANQPEQPVGVEQIDRRQFIIRLGGASAAITVVGAGLGALLGPQDSQTEVALDTGGDGAAAPWSGSNRLPNANAALQPAAGTRPEFTPVEDHYRIDINTRSPVIDGDEWRLRFTGLVENELELTLDEIRNNYEPLHQFVTLACISNRIGGDLIGTQRWTGASLKRVLEDVGLQSNATHLKITAADGFDEIVALETVDADERVMLAYDWDGLPLTAPHGFPLRIYIPNRYGMKQPKWIETIEAISEWEEGYWVRRGWDRDAIMRATSVIDTVAVDDPIQRGNDTLIPIGGIAHAGDRGISKVEVRVDEGDWVEAQLREPVSDTTWVIWRYDWPFETGDHVFTVRAYEGDDTPQIEAVAGVRPGGATGYHSLRETVELESRLLRTASSRISKR
jgi:DMSO/TMAO reductase YedYZ molybdopterin-dependent catalytic subunit